MKKITDCNDTNNIVFINIEVNKHRINLYDDVCNVNVIGVNDQINCVGKDQWNGKKLLIDYCCKCVIELHILIYKMKGNDELFTYVEYIQVKIYRPINQNAYVYEQIALAEYIKNSIF